MLNFTLDELSVIKELISTFLLASIKLIDKKFLSLSKSNDLQHIISISPKLDVTFHPCSYVIVNKFINHFQRFILVKIGILKKMVNSSTIIISLEEKNGSSQET